ncbi:MAG: deoxyribodipyrimidine photolyase [Gemmatimonadota bacterium]|nr:MAG: deoxyribodipyrimidine photolyase [Gemmatimonadota bacterium]
MKLDSESGRVRTISSAPVGVDAGFVLYYMTAFRRARYNAALDRAVALAQQLSKPLVIVEPLEIGYRWASSRHHRFLIQGMRDQASAFRAAQIAYYPYIERAPGEIRGMLESVAAEAAVVITDDYPTFHGPRVIEACERLPVRVEAVDGNGVIPLHSAGHAFPTAYSFRRYVHEAVASGGIDFPRANALEDLQLPLGELPRWIVDRWAPVRDEELADIDQLVAVLPLPQDIGPGWVSGGAVSAGERLREFVARRLEAYDEKRNDPDEDWPSGLSPFLHFGHISTHEILQSVIEGTGWTPASVELAARGSRGGWGLDATRTAFVDQVVTWRELGFNGCTYLEGYDQYGSLPEWARRTLAEHESDPREWVYDREQFEVAETHDPLWNAAQRQLVNEGRIHNYLRMLWGKKILEWSESPQEALDIMIELNNQYALDGRDPNSYSGIFWILGRYDRPWGPEREVFGKIRYMSSDNTMRKTRVTEYLDRYGSW